MISSLKILKNLVYSYIQYYIIFTNVHAFVLRLNIEKIHFIKNQALDICNTIVYDYKFKVFHAAALNVLFYQ